MTATTTTTAPADDTAVTLAEYERLAIGTGLFGGADAVTFSNGNSEWSDTWLPTETHTHPMFARAAVYRTAGESARAMCVEIVVAWDESVPEDDDERAGWEAKPRTRFGGYAMRRAYQRAFADVIERPKPATAAPKITAAEVAAQLGAIADTHLLMPEEAGAIGVELDKLYAAATAARVITPELAAAFHTQRAALNAKPAPAKPAAPRPVPAPPKVRPDQTVRRPRRKPAAKDASK